MLLTPRRVSRRPALRIASLLTFVALIASASAAQDPKSAAGAKELMHFLDAAKLDSMAAADPAAPGTFVAALYLPGTQLLVVAAKYSAPTLLLEKIKTGDFRGVYMDLHAAGVPGSRIFVQEVGPDGRMSRTSGDQAADDWEEAGKSPAFDGGKKAKIAEADYTKIYTDADERY